MYWYYNVRKVMYNWGSSRKLCGKIADTNWRLRRFVNVAYIHEFGIVACSILSEFDAKDSLKGHGGRVIEHTTKKTNF